ncbi:hypothetical protein EOW65_06690 [Sinirhodobacter ferrireducens]|uniref:Uncharacterized protein n=1 Tax=Paenirhodobacter ferrireducens TaxID=1215032 RepID=A0A443LNA7_9RHOB|nr:hypothetical protein [Sinirhodobacter ferrireducens]RWR50634.1 hypothetical protein EOW65_06690 [Sinirhodobacter ferrireducens]
MTLSPTFTPPERMAEIRRLTRYAEETRLAAEDIDIRIDTAGISSLLGDHLRMASCDAWARRGEAVAQLLIYLNNAEADGSLAECEQMLRVSYGGAA